MNIEDFKNRAQFTVPENYFEQFHSNTMKALPKKPVPQKSRAIPLTRIARYISYAAIITVIFAIGGTLFVQKNQSTDYTATGEEHYEGEYIDEILNNYPIDDYTFYCYLTGNDIN